MCVDYRLHAHLLWKLVGSNLGALRVSEISLKVAKHLIVRSTETILLSTALVSMLPDAYYRKDSTALFLELV